MKWQINTRKDSEGEHIQISTHDSKDTICIIDSNLDHARLIASAPEMLEALERVVEEYSQDTSNESKGALIARIDNANHFIKEILKKAKGE